NVASVRSVTSIGKTTQYDTTKAAVAGLTRGMAADHAADGIRVNAVCPGPIYTPFHEKRNQALGRTFEQYRDDAAKGTLLRRQAPGRWVDGEPGDAVVAAVADIEEPARRRQMDLRTGVAHGHTLGQRADRSHDGEGAGGAIDAVGRHAASLLVGEIGEIERGMEAIVPW